MAENYEKRRAEIQEIKSCVETIKKAVSENSSYVKYGVNFETRKAVEQVLSDFSVHRVALIVAH